MSRIGIEIDHGDHSQANDVQTQPLGSGPQLFKLPLRAAITRQEFQMEQDSVHPTLIDHACTAGDTNAMANATNIIATMT